MYTYKQQKRKTRGQISTVISRKTILRLRKFYLYADESVILNLALDHTLPTATVFHHTKNMLKLI